MITVGLLLAAGRSERFGEANKLLADFKGKPLLAHAADAMQLVRIDHRIAVVSDSHVADLLNGFDVLFQLEDNAPQSANLALGAERAAELNADRLLIVLADMPLVGEALMQEVLERCSDSHPAAATDGELICPPACFPAVSLGALIALEGDQGGVSLIRRLPSDGLVTAAQGLLVDVDTPDDLARLASAHRPPAS